jgi:hypothetical protein
VAFADGGVALHDDPLGDDRLMVGHLLSREVVGVGGVETATEVDEGVQPRREAAKEQYAELLGGYITEHGKNPSRSVLGDTGRDRLLRTGRPSPTAPPRRRSRALIVPVSMSTRVAG